MGAGVAWLKNNGFFSADYYPYNAGGLLSVKTSKKITTGLNQFDESNLLTASGWTLSDGYYTGSVGQLYTVFGVNSAFWYNDINTDSQMCITYTAYVSDASANARAVFNYTDGTSSFAGVINSTTESTYTVVSTSGKVVKSITFDFSNDATLYIKGFCINISCNLDGQYEPYVSHEYPLDNIELRGILKLDGNNNLYYDGDTYESNGSITRKYGIVDLGTLSWQYRSDVDRFICSETFDYKSPATTSDKAPILTIYDNVSFNDFVNSRPDKSVAMYGANSYINIRDTSFNGDAATFKTAMNGVYLVYELATPTTETADAFTNPMVVDGNGTEEFVDGRAVEIPVGHETIYVDNSDKTKLDNLPDISNDGDGTYVINQENGKQSLVTPNATDISYSNTSSGLTATKVQGAIDEVNTKVGTKANSSDVYTKSNTYNKTEVNSMLTLVKTANGNPCTFDTDLADNLVSLTAEIVATGGNGSPDSPIPINGYTEANITRCGVNLWDEQWELVNGRVTSKNFIKVTPSTRYFFYNTNLYDVTMYDNAYNNLGHPSYGSRPNGFVFQTSANCVWIKFDLGSPYGSTYNHDVSINYPETDMEYHPYTGNTYTIAFGQTVYGGVLDVTRGKLHVTYGIVDLGSCTWGGGSDAATTIVPNWLIEGYQIKSQSDVVNYNNVYSGLGWFDGVAFWTTDYTAAQREQLKSDMSGIHLCYELATPIDIDLTPVQISALVGTNNITSDLGGDVEVDYASGELAQGISKMIEANPTWKEITGTLTAGNTSIMLSDASITTESTIDVYTDTFGVDPTAVSVSAGAVTLTFAAQSSNVKVKVRVT